MVKKSIISLHGMNKTKVVKKSLERHLCSKFHSIFRVETGNDKYKP